MHPAPEHGPLDVLAALLHKLGSPLGTVTNHVHLLASSSDPDPAAAAEGIGQAADRATRILAGARRWLDAATGPLAPRPVQPGPILERAARQAGLRPELGDDPLPEILADADWLGRVVLELCCNAHAAGSQAMRVHARHRQSHVGLVFGDDGRGWGPLAPARALDLFTVGDAASLGAGMGLPVAARVLQRLGGGLEAEAGAGGEAVVALWIPAAPARGSPTEAEGS